MRLTLDTALSERETYLIGSIVSQWGFLESDIFDQTLLSFEGCESLPASMNKNAQFSAVLQLWLERVVELSDEATKLILKAQYDKIVSLAEFRQAVVHSRWEWRPDFPDEIIAVRIHNKCIKRVKFTSDDLADFATDLGEIRYVIRYPRGIQDRAQEMAAVGGYISRRGWNLLGGYMPRDVSTDPSDIE